MAGLERTENSGPAGVPVATDHQPGQSQLMQQIATCGSASVFVSFYTIVTHLLADLCVTLFIIVSLVSVIFPYSPAHLTKTVLFAGLYSLLLYQVLAKMTLPALKQVFLDLMAFSWASPVLILTREGIQCRGQWQICWRDIQSIRAKTSVSWDSDSCQDYMILEVADGAFVSILHDEDDQRNRRLPFTADNNCPRVNCGRPYFMARIDSLQFDQEEIKKCADHLWRQSREAPSHSGNHFV